MIAEIKKNKKTGNFKQVLFSVSVVVLFIVLVFFLIFTNIKISQKRAQLKQRIEQLREEVKDLEEKNNQLKEDISEAESEKYLEKVAKEQLGMKLPGEEVVIISKEEEKTSLPEQEKDNENFWNPKKWWEWLRGK